MPFLTSNQQHQSTEGSALTADYKPITSYYHDCDLLEVSRYLNLDVSDSSDSKDDDRLMLMIMVIDT